MRKPAPVSADGMRNSRALPARTSRRPGGRLAGFVALLTLAVSACAAAEDSGHKNEEAAVTTAAASGSDDHPGGAPYPPELSQRLARALAAQGDHYEPRTHHLREDASPRFTNRLILEDSPYLQQHAHNPVDWYPWGPEAFARATAENKPIFLSIGYSTCHWCHVMERESFESLEIARLLNAGFVCIKIDRERRPDIDEIYMTAVQMLTRRGGWPMSSFLTPEGKPFFGGTYFPPQQFTVLLERVGAAWGERRDALVADAERVAAAVSEAIAARGEAEAVGAEAIEAAVQQLLARHDAALGGFGKAPKFPHEPELLLLLDHALRSGDEAARATAEKSLEAMARGGIYDQVGGGFHRYSTDAQWLVPHFEKMLYNQAHLSRAYAAAWRLTGDPFYERVARQTLDYVLREMRAPAGSFYSATDADSEGTEGEFFLWTADQLRALLRDADAALAIDVWGVSEAGNFEGKNILHLPRPLAGKAAEHQLSETQLLERLDHIRDVLWNAREQREHPLRDDKILTAWNGMMITAFAKAGEILGEARYLEAARTAAERLWTISRRDGGELWRVHLAGSSSVPALQNDYAHFAEACLALYDAGGEPVWLERARQLADTMLERFWDGEAGGFFMNTAGADPHMIAQPKSPNDGAIPSGNSVALRVLAQLAARTGESRYSEKAGATLAAFSAQVGRYAAGYAYMLLGAAELAGGAAGPRRYAAAGNVAVRAHTAAGSDGLSLAVELRIRDGWHVNAHRPLSEELIPTTLAVDGGRGGWRLDEVAYPEPERVTLGFQEEPLAIYQGTVELSGRVGQAAADDGARILAVRLRLQACNDRICLRPEEMTLEVPAAGGG